jgi:plastocyanin
LVFLLVACGGNSEPEEVEFTIEMSEFSYSPDTIELKVGQTVTLNLVNVGQLEHEVMFGREVLLDNSLPSGYELDLFEHAGIEPSVVMEMHMEEHEEAEHEEAEHAADEAEHEEAEHVMVTEEMVGTWEIGCFLQSGSHHLAGMKGSLEVDA